ncbi:hypothetical protein BGZ76_004514 [Entomortierella beljakovae]|nr:hypothetical protein BGZ76_004514 [Entomortierella beljakovae]
MSEPVSTTSEPSTLQEADPSSTNSDAPKKLRCWGSFEYEENGTKHIVQFTKEGNDGESGIGGYVFGRRSDCDFVPLVSGRHFLIYKEMVHDKDLKKPVERVFLKDFRAPDGELFDQIIDKQKFTEVETRHIFKQILEGVKYLHDNGIVHRDLKPENILVMDKEALTVKISDFGMAKMIGEHVFVNTICGTPSYVAPEIIRNAGYGKAVDMWSLGVVLYVCLCGFPPFSDDLAPPKLRIQVLQSMYTFPSPFWDDVSDEAVDFVQGLLAQNAEDRLSIDDALEHVWMTLEDDEGTMPEESRTGDMPQVRRLLSRVMTERADRAVQRGVRVGYSQPFGLSQTIPDLPEDEADEDNGGDGSPEVYSQEYEENSDNDGPGNMVYGSGIGIFSQEGMVRGTGMDTDSELDEDEEPGSFYHSLNENSYTGKPNDNASDTGTNEAVAGNDSDRSFMSIQDSFNGASNASPDARKLLDKSMKDSSMNGVDGSENPVVSANSTGTTKACREESVPEEDERTSKKARTD